MIGRSKKSYEKGSSKDDRRSRRYGARRRRRRWFGLVVLLLIVAAGGAYASGLAPGGTPIGGGDLSRLFGGEGYPSSQEGEAVAGPGEDVPEGPTPEQLGATPAAAAYAAVAPELPGADSGDISSVYKSKLDPSWASVHVEAPGGEEGTYVVFLRQEGDSWEARRSIRADEPEHPEYEKVVLDEAGVPRDLIDSDYPENLASGLSSKASGLLAEPVDPGSLPDVKKVELPTPVLSTDDVPETARDEVEGGLEKARRTIEEYATEYDGVAGVYAQDLEGGYGYGINEDETYFGASVMKVPLMIAVFRKIDEGELSLGDRFPTETGDWAGGAGWLQWEKAGTSHTVEDYLYMSLTQSDNVATNALLRRVGGAGYVNEVASSLGAEDTVLYQKVTSERAVVPALDNRTTPRDMAGLLAKIMYGQAASPESCKKMVEIMSTNNLQSSLKDGLPRGVEAANKGGWLYKVYNDVGIVWNEDHPYVVAIFSKYGSEDVEVGKALMQRLSEGVWQAQGGSSGKPRVEARNQDPPVPETPDPEAAPNQETPDLVAADPGPLEPGTLEPAE